MLSIPTLNLGSIDTINYKKGSEKEFLSTIFYRDHFLENILTEKKNYYVVGEKGTGKTAYATLLNNSDYKNHKCRIRNISETDYQKFIYLREHRQLTISDYGEIWTVILLLLLAGHLAESEPSDIIRVLKFNQLRTAVNEFYHNAFSPEITYALEFVENSEISASLFSKHLTAGGKTSERLKETTEGFQTSGSNLTFGTHV
jgi:hypothetical protein